MDTTLERALDAWAGYTQSGAGRDDALASLEEAVDELLDTGQVDHVGGAVALLVGHGVSQQDADEVADRCR